jgi:hypothetical protein
LTARAICLWRILPPTPSINSLRAECEPPLQRPTGSTFSLSSHSSPNLHTDTNTYADSEAYSRTEGSPHAGAAAVMAGKADS